MLFGYPEAATAENWLHESLLAVIETVHIKVDAGEDLPEWPLILPIAHQGVLKCRRGLRDRIESYREAVATLMPEQRAEVLSAMRAQNRIPELLRCESECPGIADLPDSAQAPIRSLFYFAFDLLTDLGIRHKQYKTIFQQIGSRVCPFCGCEAFDHPNAPQEDFDHYLPRSRYPFAAANLRNLAPMGHKCNSKYKLATDILRCDDGKRRRVFDPYSAQQLRLSLENSQVSQTVDGSFVQNWAVEFEPAIEEVETWDTVFAIRERYRRDVLEDGNFKNWIWDFRNWCIERPARPTSDQELLSTIESYERILSGSGFNDRAFLKAAVFRFLLARANAGCQRVLDLLRDASGMSQFQAGGA